MTIIEPLNLLSSSISLIDVQSFTVTQRVILFIVFCCIMCDGVRFSFPSICVFNFAFAFCSIFQVNKLHLRMRTPHTYKSSCADFSLSIQSSAALSTKNNPHFTFCLIDKNCLKAKLIYWIEIEIRIFRFDFPRTKQHINIMHSFVEIMFSCGVTAIATRQCSISLHLNRNHNPYIEPKSTHFCCCDGARAGANFVKTKSITDLPHYELIAKLL